MRIFPLLFLFVFLLACGDSGTGSSAPAAVGVVSGSGQPATVGLPAANPLVARVTGAGGRPVQGVPVQWAVASGGGSLSAASTVTDADGQAQVQWTLGTRTEAQTVTATVAGLPPATFTITPAAGTFARVTLSPDSVELTAVNQTASLQATFTDMHGNAMERPAAIVWTSLDQNVATLQTESSGSSIGVVARANGRARVQVRIANRADTAIVQVRQHPASIVVTLRGGPSISEGDTTRALAVVRDAGGSAIPNAPVTWSTTDPSGATIDATGKITALRGDTLDVVAASGSVTGRATLFVSGPFRVSALAAGAHHSCALAPDRRVYCWGWNQSGQLGVPAPAAEPDRWAAAPVAVQTPERFVALSASAMPDPTRLGDTWSYKGHTCGITTSSALLCWGDNTQGQLAREGPSAPIPMAVTGGGAWSAVATGGRHTCAITAGGQTYCWGLDSEGQTGGPATGLCAPVAGTGPDEPCARTPVLVAGGLTFTRISAGPAHTCALTSTGAAYCWGRNGAGQLGNGTTAQADAPVAVLGGHRFLEISAGGAHTCARATTGVVYCWGANDVGQLGTGTMTQARTPVAAIGTYGSVQAGWAHTCGLAADGRAFCWGSNARSQRGTTSAPLPPSAVEGGFRFTALTTGGFHTCGIRATDDAAMCWGENYIGKLGSSPDVFDRPLPRLVRAP